MSRSVNISPLGLYNWDNTVFDLMQLPAALNRDILVQNLLAETAELEVLYPNPVVFKNLVGVWSTKNLPVWNKLYETTQFEYNPIENYDRYETGSDTGTGSTTHSGTDSTTETTTHSGTDGRTEAITTGGTDVLNMSRQEGGTEGKTGTSNMEQGGTESVTISRQEGGTETEATTSSITQGGQDSTTGDRTSEHYIAGYNSMPSGQDDGLVKQSRDTDQTSGSTTYGKTESGTGNKTTTFGKTNTDTETTTFGKTETNSDTTLYGKTENVQETKTYGESVNHQSGLTHGERVATANSGQHTLHAHGNIGTMTVQDMIQQERRVDRFNIYDFIIEDFKMRLCILIY